MIYCRSTPSLSTNEGRSVFSANHVFRLALVIAIGACVGGCAGIPLATLWHFRSFGPKNLLQVQPADVRAAIELADGVTLKNPPGQLDVTLTFDGKPADVFHMPLKTLESGASLDSGVGEADPGKHWYLLALAPKGVEQFDALQNLLRRHMKPDGHLDHPGTLEIEIKNGDMEFTNTKRQQLKQTQRLFIRTRLQLLPSEPFYTLYEGLIPFEAGSAAAES